MKILFRIALVLALSLFTPALVVPAVHAATEGVTGSDVSGFVPLAPIPGLTQQDGAALNTTSLTAFLNNLYKYLVGLAAILAIIQIIRGGLEISTQESISKHTDGRNHIYQAIMGLVLVLSPVLVFSIINPSILNLGIALPNLNAETPYPSSGGGPSTPDTPATGCTPGPDSQYLIAVACATDNDASSYSCPNELSTNKVCGGGHDQNGNCVGGNKVYCEATIDVDYYKFTHWVGWVVYPLSDGKVTPGYAEAQQTFATGCSASGGVVSSRPTVAGAAILTSFLVPSVLRPDNHCGTDDGSVTYTDSDGIGVVCYGETLKCTPPGQ